MEDYRKTIRVIGFDLDRTLYPKTPEIDKAIQSYIYAKIAQHKNCSIYEAGEMFRGIYKEGNGLSGRKTLIALGIPNSSEIVQEALEQADIASKLSSDPKTIELLQQIKARYSAIDLITGSKLSIVQEKLDALKIPLESFTHIISGDSTSKSDLSAFKRWLSYYQISPEKFLYIGDQPLLDFEMPKQLGIRSILVNTAIPDPSLEVLQLPTFHQVGMYLL